MARLSPRASRHGNQSKVSYAAVKIAIDAKNGSIFRITQSCRALGNRIEHGLKLSRRAGDHSAGFRSSPPPVRVTRRENAAMTEYFALV